MNLENKVAIVTGGASGIGLATAETLAAAGAHVAVGDIARENGETAARLIRERGFDARFFDLDVTDPDSIASFKTAVLAWRPRVDIVVNVAGWGKVQPFVENTPEFWRKVVDLNLMGPIMVTRAFLDGMMEQQSGKVIVNIASMPGVSGAWERPSIRRPMEEPLLSPRAWRAKWHDTTSTSTAFARGQRTRRS
jgi:2-hydroxycyclohexanecarboxyl-CoA dehydrogenase